MEQQQVSNSTAAGAQGPTWWEYIIVAGRIQAKGNLLAEDARDALSRTLTHTDPEGRMYGEVLGVSPDVLHDAPGNATANYEIAVPGGLLKLRKVTMPLSDRVLHMAVQLRAEQRLKVSIDFAYTVKYDKVNILCASVYADAIREACVKHQVEIASMHTYD